MVSLYFGKPRCGKTTHLTKIALEELKRIKEKKSRYNYVVSNVNIKGVVFTTFENLAKYEFNKCLILLDEITLDADSRDFKKFTKAHKEFFVMHGHYKNNIILYTQIYNRLDSTIRDIVDSCFHMWKFFCFTISTRIPTSIVIPEETGDINQGYRKPKRFEAIMNTKIMYRPKYYKYFDSFYIRTKKTEYAYAQHISMESGAKATEQQKITKNVKNVEVKKLDENKETKSS